MLRPITLAALFAAGIVRAAGPLQTSRAAVSPLPSLQARAPDSTTPITPTGATDHPITQCSLGTYSAALPAFTELESHFCACNDNQKAEILTSQREDGMLWFMCPGAERSTPVSAGFPSITSCGLTTSTDLAEDETSTFCTCNGGDRHGEITQEVSDGTTVVTCKAWGVDVPITTEVPEPETTSEAPPKEPTTTAKLDPSLGVFVEYEKVQMMPSATGTWRVFTAQGSPPEPTYKPCKDYVETWEWDDDNSPDEEYPWNGETADEGWVYEFGDGHLFGMENCLYEPDFDATLPGNLTCNGELLAQCELYGDEWRIGCSTLGAGTPLTGGDGWGSRDFYPNVKCLW